MRKHIYNSLIAFFGGLFGVSVLFILLWLLVNAAHLELPVLTFYGFLLLYLGYSFIEEGTKFLLIKRDMGQFPYGFLLGFGFGMGETILKYPFWEFGVVPTSRFGAILLHSFTAGIICYFVKKDRPVLGLAIAILAHTGFNLFIQFSI